MTRKAGSVAAPSSAAVSNNSEGNNCNSDDTMDGGVAVEDFINTGRTGRRNAVPDITDHRGGSMSTAGMDLSFNQLSMSEPKPGTSDSGKESGAQSDDKSQCAGKS